MPSTLSGNTLGLKFMQRAAAKKAAAQPAPAVQAAVETSSKEPAGKREQDDEEAFPIASTSKLPPHSRPSITTESSYLAFPILSAAYGPTSSVIGHNANGRMSFGEALKPKAEADDENMEPAVDDEDLETEVRAKPKKRKEKAPHPAQPDSKPAGFIKPAAFDGLPAPIRKRKETEPVQEVESDVELDQNFADEMIEEARQKRKAKTQSANGNPEGVEGQSTNTTESGKKKKRKKQKKEGI